jgi:hypothetical protein
METPHLEFSLRNGGDGVSENENTGMLTSLIKGEFSSIALNPNSLQFLIRSAAEILAERS